MSRKQNRVKNRPKAQAKNSWFRMQASSENEAEIYIYDEIGYPYQGSAPYPQIQTGIDDVYSPTDRARKFLIRCEKTSPTTQTVKVYDGWETIDTPVLNYTGDWTQGKFCGGGIIGGVYATRNIARTVRITQLLIRKFK
ncbi:hypothetical protein FOE36_00815 [Escherichia coli]|nr:hypothetical protein [Escherichia coli]